MAVVNTWRTVLTAALRLIGIPGEGQTPTDTQLNDALFAALEILDSWNVSADMLVSDQFQQFDNLASNEPSYPMGPGAVLDVPIRPTQIDFASFHYTGSSPAIDIPLEVLSAKEYASVKVKSINSPIPRWIYIDEQWPIANVYFWPLLTGPAALILTYPSYFPQVTLDTVFNLPPGYQKVLRFDVACIIAPEYGKVQPQDLAGVVETNRDLIISQNKRVSQLSYGFDCQGVSSRNGLWNALDDQIS